MRRQESRGDVHSKPRDGFTLIELLVVISIIAVLTSMILPAVLQARNSARSMQCKNRIRNVALAMIGSAGSERRFPASGNIGLDANGDVAPFHSWVVDLLPWLDHAGVSNKWDFDRPINDPVNREVSNVFISVLTCPVDFSVTRNGDLSYVANGGFGWTTVSSGIGDCPVGSNGIPIDFDGDGTACTDNDRQLFFRTGLFFLESWQTPGTIRHHSLDTVLDGNTQTIMLSENVRAGYDPYLPDTNWATPDMMRNCFLLSPRICRNAQCSPGNVDYALANSGDHAINTSIDFPEGEAPWPSSYHHGGVHFAFVDGHVQFVSDKVDGLVYASLVTPQGSLLEDALFQPLVSDADY